MCEFELSSYEDIHEGAWYTIQVPHIVKNPTTESKIIVKHRDKYKKTFTYAVRLLTGEEPPNDDNVNVYYRFHDKYIEIFTHHFSQFVSYAENTTLQAVMENVKWIEMLVFGKWHYMRTDSAKEMLEINILLCNLHYKQVSIHVQR